MSFLVNKDKFVDIWSPEMTVPIPALDIVIFTLYKGELCVVLIKSSINWEACYTLPWWIVAKWYSLEQNFDSILERKTWIKWWIYKEQLYTFGDPERDARGHTITVIYFALISTNVFIKDVDFTKVELLKYADIISMTFDQESPISFGYDHKEIIVYARQRLKWKLEYTNIAKDMLGESFRISQLQEIYEMVLNEKIDKRNFQKKIFKLKMLKETGKLDRSTNRPAKLYSFVDKELKVYEIM